MPSTTSLVVLGAVVRPDDRADASSCDAADDDRAGAVAEQERAAAVVVVDQVGEPLRAGDEHVLGRAASRTASAAIERA